MAVGATRAPLTFRLGLYLSPPLRANECWPWIGQLHSDGYGVIKGPDGKNQKAHRLVYELLVGPIREGMTLDHTCHNRDAACRGGRSCPHRRCCNPKHLRQVTGAENSSAGVRGRQTKCGKGHDLTDPKNLKPNKRGVRQCRQCGRDAARDRYLRRKRGEPPRPVGRPRTRGPR